MPDGRFVFVRQFRKPLERVMLETVAGKLEPGEDPEECARREVMEETGYRAGESAKLGVIYPSPGYTDETIHVYHVKLIPEMVTAGGDEDEDLEVVHLTSAEIEEMVASGDIEDGKTLAMWLLYKSKMGN